MIEGCSECYGKEMISDTNDWFKETCWQPHLLVWGKLWGYPYWPAKVMYVESEKICVLFFGDLKHALIPAEKCFLFSGERPQSSTKKSNKNHQTFEKALKVSRVILRK